MNSCKITIQRKVGEQWPVVLKQSTADSALAIRTVGSLSLNMLALTAQVTPRDYGVMLGQALFQGAVRDAFLHARAQSEDNLSVQLLVEAPDLSTLRWERLCAPLDEHWHFLAHDQRAPLSLALSSPSTRRFPLLRRENLRALVLVASPQGLARFRLSPFNVEATVASVRRAFGSIPCDVLSTTPDAVGPPTLDTLCERLSNTSYTLLHVVCHGRYSSDISDTVIYLANEEQQVDPVTGQRLITRLSQVRGEQGLPQFAFLATCESASPEAEGVLGGLAQSLVRDLGMPAVLAMTETVSISTVDAVTSQFYRRLVAHGHVDLALAEACAGVAERADSLVPALYSRLGARPLFEQQALAAHQQPLSLTHQQRKQNRTRMLERVQRIWISGVLEQSLHGVALLSLGLQEQPNAVTDPWRLVMQEAEQPARSLPPGTRIMQVYDSSDHELLILGAPGAGKTTLLLELTRDLLQRAKEDDTHPIPVVFHLSSWAVKRQPLKQWLMEELNLKYQVPPKLAHDWIEADQVLPLLDGLDEVKVDARPACIETINIYHQEHGFLPLVVASRSADYLAQTTRLTLTNAVIIQLLTQQQVDIYLASGGKPLRTLRAAFQQDTALRELAETPLMLSILTLTYHDMPIEDLLQGGIAPTRQQIFERYVRRMLVHRSGNTQYTPEQTRGWLTWLAKQLKQQGQTVFYIEHIQAGWLSKASLQRVYIWLAVRLPNIVIGMLVATVVSTLLNFTSSILTDNGELQFPEMLIGGLLGLLLRKSQTFVVTPEESAIQGKGSYRWQFLRQKGSLRNSLIVGLVFALCTELTLSGYVWWSKLLIELIWGLCFGLAYLVLSVFVNGMYRAQDQISTLWRSDEYHQSKNGQVWQALKIGALVSVIFGLSAGLSYIANGLGVPNGFGEAPVSYVLADSLNDGLRVGLITGLSGILLSLVFQGMNDVIQLADRVVWSKDSLLYGLMAISHKKATVLVGLGIGIIAGLSEVMSSELLNWVNAWQLNWLRDILIPGLGTSVGVGLGAGLSYWVLLGLWQGISRETIDDRHRHVPNQGIRRSMRNSFLLGIICGIVIGITTFFTLVLNSGLSNWSDVGLIGALNSGVSFGLFFGLINGLLGGILGGLLNGGLASWRHYVLRFLLWRTKSMPWNYPRFLDYAAEHILLRKVGGGYIFIHRLLLEYFASLDAAAPSVATKVEKRQEELAS